MTKLVVLFGLLVSLNFNVFVDAQDGVAILDNDPSDAQIQVVRDSAKNHCDEVDENQREDCVADYYAQHNLEEEPSCD